MAFAQSLHETGYFKFGGIVQPGRTTTAGSGPSTGTAPDRPRASPTRAPASGLKSSTSRAYATTEPLVNECIDPRFSLVARGVAEFVEWLGAADNPSGRGWAVPGRAMAGRSSRCWARSRPRRRRSPRRPRPPDDGYPEGTPAWQKEGFEALVERGIINSPEYWKTRFDKTMTAGEILAILGRM